MQQKDESPALPGGALRFGSDVVRPHARTRRPSKEKLRWPGIAILASAVPITTPFLLKGLPTRWWLD